MPLEVASVHAHVYVEPMHSTTPAPKTLRFRAVQARLFCNARGLTSDPAIAKAVGLERTTIYRLMCGDAAPSETSIAAFLSAFPEQRFEDFFEVAPARVRARAA
jgi:predicted DNA-binding transcriptional regulator AlpA